MLGTRCSRGVFDDHACGAGQIMSLKAMAAVAVVSTLSPLPHQIHLADTEMAACTAALCVAARKGWLREASTLVEKRKAQRKRKRDRDLRADASSESDFAPMPAGVDVNTATPQWNRCDCGRHFTSPRALKSHQSESKKCRYSLAFAGSTQPGQVAAG